MAWYRSGTVTASAGQNVITGTGTQWANNVMGVAPGQALVVQRSDGNTLIYEILAVDSNTKIRINGNVVDVLSAANYGIQTSVANSYSALARETSAQLALYQQLLQDWQQITTGTGSVSIIAPDGSTVVIPSLAQLSRIGIGLPTQPTIANFDFQTAVFTSGANYAVSSSTWLNVPVEVVYPTGIIISITVISVPGSNVILKLVPHVSSAGKYNTYYVRMSGTVGSRTIYVIQDWNSASPIPITGGGTGANTLSGAQTALGIVSDAFGANKVASTPWIPLTLQSGWTTATGFRSVYRKVLGMIFIEMVVNVAAGAGSLVFTLPVGYRPQKSLIVLVASTPKAGFSSPRMIITPEGTASIYDIDTTATFAAVLFSLSLE